MINTSHGKSVGKYHMVIRVKEYESAWSHMNFSCLKFWDTLVTSLHLLGVPSPFPSRVTLTIDYPLTRIILEESAKRNCHFWKNFANIYSKKTFLEKSKSK